MASMVSLPDPHALVASSVERGAVPDRVFITRQVFEARLRGKTLASWSELLAAVGEESPAGSSKPGLWGLLSGQQRVVYGPLPEGASSSVVRCDPMQVFAWVSTLLMEICLWGLVAYFGSVNAALGLVVTLLYGAALLLMLSQNLAPQLAGMLWPNLPCAVAATGGFVHAIIQPYICSNDNERGNAGLVLCCCVLPSTLATLFWMKELPRDPDRAVLASNLFLGAWASILCLLMLCRGYELVEQPSLLFGSLLLVGVAWMAAAGALLSYPSRWSSVELVSWMLNIGSLGAFFAFGVLLGIPATSDLLPWLEYTCGSVAICAVGVLFGRTFPVLLSAVGVATVAIRVCCYLWELTDNVLVGLVAFGAVGVGIALLTQVVWRSRAPTYEAKDTAQPL